MRPYLNKAHRYAGITIAPFVVIQVLSGLFLDFGLFRREPSAPGSTATERVGWDLYLVKAHFGPGFLSDAYHILLACGILWMVYSGCLLYLRIMRIQRQARVARLKA